MYHQTQANTQVFTVFGTYLVEQHGDHSALENDRKIEWADVLRRLRAGLGGINPDSKHDASNRRVT